LDDVVKCYSVDPHHVILNGFSAGGTMAYFIGLSRAQRFSGLAIQSSSLSAGENVAGRSLLPAPWKVPVSHFHGDQDQNFLLADAQSGITRLQNAGHPVSFHVFSGGHQATAADALVEYDELKSTPSP
jgi:phospholipase/carboxylesterase